jgi:hypothetical protein
MDAEIKPLANLPKKNRHILRWIFNILCLLVISLLFLVGFWTKNLNLLWLIIPVALWIAAFKRKTAGWLALGFLACIMGIVVWLFLPDSGNWRPYNFDYELKDLEAKRAVPNAENAAIAYQKIIARLDVNSAPPFYDDVNEPSTHVFWKGSDHPETAAFIDAHMGLITDAMAASRMEKCAFPIQTDPLKFSIDTVAGMRQITYLLMSAANRDMGEERVDEALDKYFSVIHLGRQVKQQPTIIFFLVGKAIEDLGAYKLPYIIVESNSTPEERKAIGSVFKTYNDWPKFFPKMSQYEKVLGENMLGLFYETNEQGSIRYMRKIPIPESLAKESTYQPTVLQKHLFKLVSITLWFVLPSDPRVLGTAYAKAFDEALISADANQWDVSDSAQFGSITMLFSTPNMTKTCAKIGATSFTRIQQTYSRTIVMYRTMHILLALREYKDTNGHWPHSLEQVRDKVPAEAMVDPFTGGSFIYKTKGDKFLLYSVGENKIDEKCMERPKGVSWKKTSGQFDDILIWPQKREQVKEFFDAN